MIVEKIRIFDLDGLKIKIPFRYNENSKMFFGEYPDFEEQKLFTDNGHRVVAAMQDGCEFAEGDSSDCGSCKHYFTEKAGDLIGLCRNEAKNISQKEE